MMDKRKSGGKSFSTFQVIVLILIVLMFQRVLQQSPDYSKYYLPDEVVSQQPKQKQSSNNSNNLNNNNNNNNDRYVNPLSIPQGQAPNLPSIQVTDKALEDRRTIYGGKGDAKHLGGFTDIDMMGISPATWKHAVRNWTVQSVLDVGCGKGTSTSWFATHGLRTECVEGSHDAIQQSMVPDKSILTEHDFSRGPWWPAKTFDMVWSVEFLEHVNLQFHYNYISTFRKAAILMVTSSNWGGWHHVEVHDTTWWIRKYESYGFRFDQALTDEIKHVASIEKGSGETFPPNGKAYNAQHVWTTMMVFINPAVAALPEHAHLFGEFGCYSGAHPKLKQNRECGIALKPNQKKSASMETPLDPSYYPLPLTPEQDQVWYDVVKKAITPEQ